MVDVVTVIRLTGVASCASMATCCLAIVGAVSMDAGTGAGSVDQTGMAIGHSGRDTESAGKASSAAMASVQTPCRVAADA